LVKEITTDCVSVHPFEGDTDQSMTRAFVAQLAPHVPKGTNCLVSLSGKLTTLKSDNLWIVSRVAAGAEVELAANNDLLWRGEHTASSWGGGLPIDPISAGLSLANAIDNSREEQSNRVLDDLARRLVSTMPNFSTRLEQETKVLDAAPISDHPELPPPAIKPIKPLDAHDLRMQAIAAYDAGDRSQAVALFERAGRAYIDQRDLNSADYMAAIIHQIALIDGDVNARN
jgi:hypothetical protein